MSAVSVYIPILDVIRGGVDVVETLRGVDAATIRRKQEAIARIAPRVQYSVVMLPTPEMEPQLSLYSNGSWCLYERICLQVPPSILDAAIAAETSNARPLPLPPGKIKRKKKIGTPGANTTSPAPTPAAPLEFKPIATWEPPFEDAVDVAIRALLSTTTLEPMNGFTAEQWAERIAIKAWPEPSPRKIEI